MQFVVTDPSQNMPTIMKSTDLFKFDGLQKGDILLCRTFDYLPADGVNLDLEHSIDDEVFRVVQLLENSIGEVNNLIIEPLIYCANESEVDCAGYQIYGSTFVKIRENLPGREYRYFNFKRYMQTTLGGKFVNCNVNPNGDVVRTQIFAGVCPAGCNNGWLRNIERLKEILPDHDLPALPEFRPLCPVCYGQSVTKKQMEYRALRQRDRNAHLPDWLLFETFLNHRRWLLGYDQACDCVYCTLPLSTYPHPESHREAVNMYHETFEYHAVTMPVDRPTSERVIEALSRKAYAEADTEDTQCTVCQNDFSRETRVLELPCKHVICETGCIEWLRHQNSCPVCRHKLASARDDNGNGAPGAAGNVANDRPLTFEEMAGRMPPVPAYFERYHADDIANLAWRQTASRQLAGESPGPITWVNDPELYSEDLYVVDGGGHEAFANIGQGRLSFVERSNEARAIRRHAMYPAHFDEVVRGINEVAIEDGDADMDMDDDNRENPRPRNGSMASVDSENLLAAPDHFQSFRPVEAWGENEEMLRARWADGRRGSVRGPAEAVGDAGGWSA